MVGDLSLVLACQAGSCSTQRGEKRLESKRSEQKLFSSKVLATFDMLMQTQRRPGDGEHRMMSTE
eukprot:1161229-Pelagomonas_calceolata.AAC.1